MTSDFRAGSAQNQFFALGQVLLFLGLLGFVEGEGVRAAQLPGGGAWLVVGCRKELPEEE